MMTEQVMLGCKHLAETKVGRQINYVKRVTLNCKHAAETKVCYALALRTGTGGNSLRQVGPALLTGLADMCSQPRTLNSGQRA